MRRSRLRKRIIADRSIFEQDNLQSFTIGTTAQWWSMASLDYYLNFPANVQKVTSQQITDFVNHYTRRANHSSRRRRRPEDPRRTTTFTQEALKWNNHCIDSILLLLCCVTLRHRRRRRHEQGAVIQRQRHPVIIGPADNQIVSVIIGLEGGVAAARRQPGARRVHQRPDHRSSGSKKYDKDAFGSSSPDIDNIIGGGDLRGINYAMNAPVRTSIRRWDVLASLILHPLYDEVAYRNIMQYSARAGQGTAGQPGAQAYMIADSLVKQGNPVLRTGSHQPDVRR